MDVPLLLADFTLGLFAFFAPCGFPMLPAYIAYYLPRDAIDPPGRALARGIGGGLLAAAGAFLALLLIGALAVALGTPFKARVAWLELLGGATLLVLGAATIAGRAPTFRIGIRPTQARSAGALLGFGALYAATASSCVAPVMLGVLVPALTRADRLAGLLAIASYAAGMSALMLLASVAIALGGPRTMQRARKVLPHAERAAGAILLAIGAYLCWYWGASEFGWPAPPTVGAP